MTGHGAVLPLDREVGTGNRGHRTAFVVSEQAANVHGTTARGEAHGVGIDVDGLSAAKHLVAFAPGVVGDFPGVWGTGLTLYGDPTGAGIEV